MAMSKSQINKKERDKYAKNKKYREYKKKYRKDYEKNHEKHEEKMSREYYAKHPSYRKAKIQQAKRVNNKKKRSK